MILRLALRFSFSKDFNHRGSAIRIALSLMLSLSVLMAAMSVMDYLQSGRFEGIRDSVSFDVTVSGDCRDEMKERYPDASVFVYGETEALASGSAYTLRYVDGTYDGGIMLWQGEKGGLLVPYSVFAANGYREITVTRIGRGRSGVMMPINDCVMIRGLYRLESGINTAMLFMPLEAMDDSVPLYTAIKGVDAAEAEHLRASGFDAISWKEKEESLYGAFLIERVMMIVMLSLLFVVILVSLKQSVDTEIRGKEKELMELEALGLTRSRVFLSALLSSFIVLLLGIIGGFVLSHILLEAAASFLMRFFLSSAELRMQYPLFFIFSCLMLFFAFIFTLSSLGKLWKKDIMEVLCE